MKNSIKKLLVTLALINAVLSAGIIPEPLPDPIDPPEWSDLEAADEEKPNCDEDNKPFSGD